MDSSLKQRQDENAEYKEAGHLRYRCTRLYSWSHHVGDFNWNMSREMFVGCVDVTAHCKPVHKVHPWYACSIDELCIGFTTDTLYFAHIYISVDVSQVRFRFSIFQHHQLRHTDTPWHTIMFWGLIRSYAYGVWRSRFDFVAFCGEGAAMIGIRFWLLDRVSIQSRTWKIHTISIMLEWHRNPQLKLILGERGYFYPVWMVWLFGKGLPNAINYHLKRLHRSSNLLHPDTTDMPEIIYTHIHLNSYAIISMKKKVGQSI